MINDYVGIMNFYLRINFIAIHVIEELGAISKFGAAFFRWIGERPFRWRNWTTQMNSIGVDSTPIILLVSLFTGAVFALQTGYAFRLFNAETMVGSTVGLSLTREIAPVFAALMVTARVGSAMAAELGTMRVTEQIDALEAMAVNPFHFLVVPRVVGATLMLPLLTALFNFVGYIGAYLVGVGLLGIPEGPFIAKTEFLYIFPNYPGIIAKTEFYVDNDDLFGGLFKAAVFGFLLALISCYQGYKTEGGAAGVGRATTRAVVVSSVTILVVDYFLTQWILEIIER